MITQNAMIRLHLESGKTLTSLEAVDFFGITRLAARISDLKKDGLPIISEMKDVRNRFGTACRVAEYKLIQKVTQLEMEVA